MSSDVVLTAAMRNNLLSLQNTQRLIDTTQQRLATGLKVSSALDNPQNFFASQALSNRAGDLGRLLDGISQSIRTIEEADKGVTALNNLLEQASAITQSARDELAASEGTARIVGNVDLRNTGTGDLTVDLGVPVDAGLNIITTDDLGNQITVNVQVNAGDTAQSFAAEITNRFADDENGEIKAYITKEGFLAIESKGGRTFRLEDDGAGTPFTQAGLDAIGLGDYFVTENRTGATTTNLAATVVAGNTVSSISLYEGAGDLVEAGDTIGGRAYTDSSGNTALSMTTGEIAITMTRVDGTTESSIAVDVTTGSFQDFVDSINENEDLNQLVRAEFDSKTGQLRLTSLSDQVANVAVNITNATAGDTIGFGFGDPSGNLDSITAGAGAEDISIRFNSSTASLDALAANFNTLREQIDTLVKDAQYRGINLLQGDDLVTYFNENNSSSLRTEGQVFTSDGLGVTMAAFRSSEQIELSAAQARDALTQVRSFGSSLANNLSIIQTRREFTEGTIVTLNAGASDLTRADENEEGANLLALQTRQQLGVTSLSLASQSQQSVLRLF